MPIASNRMSYTDCYEILDKAGNDPKGIRVPFDSRREARHYQMRLHNSRAVDRRENKSLYQPGDPLYGQSSYDVYSIRMREGDDGTWFVYIEPKDKYINATMVESLSEIEGEDEVDEAVTNQT